MFKLIPAFLIFVVLLGGVYFGFIKKETVKAPESTLNVEELAKRTGLSTEFSKIPEATGNITDTLNALVAGSNNEEVVITSGDFETVEFYESADLEINSLLKLYDETGI